MHSELIYALTPPTLVYNVQAYCEYANIPTIKIQREAVKMLAVKPMRLSTDGEFCYKLLVSTKATYTYRNTMTLIVRY